MAGRSAEASAFRPARTVRPAAAPSRRQAVAMLLGLVLVASGVAAASYLVKPNKARSFDLFYGSLFINDERAPVAVDLTNGKPTVRLVDAAKQVSAKNPADLGVLPLTGGTLLLNRATGEFNIVDATGLVVKTEGGGVPLPASTGATGSVGIAAGRDAYVLRTGAAGTSVFLVGQSTVQQATGLNAKVTPRASGEMPEPTDTAAGAQTSADGDLWLLVGPPAERTVRQLSVPRGSDAGVTLDAVDHGTVSGAAALAHAARNTDGSGGEVVAVASATRLELFAVGGSLRRLDLTGLEGTDRVLPATNQDGRLRFLFHTAGGWRLVSVGADGRGLRGPVAVRGIDAQVPLAAPATSRDGLYTMDQGTSGRLWRIGDDGAATAVTGPGGGYPTARSDTGRELEAAAFGDAYAIARGARVVFDSPNHVKALAVFTDGSRPPLTIDKSAATDLNAAGGAAALAARRNDARTRDPRRPKPREAPQPAAPINNAIDCKTVKQVPHIPTITQATPGSRSVQLLWSYPLLDTQDCAPSTYTVDVRLLSANAPSPPASVTVQGQNGVTIAKLFPSTRYQLTVTAFINGKGTPSRPVEVTTGPEGPAAPTNVRAGVDSAGNWTLTWNSCGGVRDGCVPTSSWNVVPALCDGLPGLSSPPAVQSVAGDPTQHTFRAVYPGNDGLLGHGLSFQIIGVGEQGTVGTPGSSGGCAYSWSPPIASQISLLPSIPDRKTQHGQTTTATLTLRLGGNPVRTVGGIGAQYTYKLLSGDSVVATKGPTSETTVTLPGIAPGRSYTAVAVVSPPRHPEASATIGPVPLQNAVSDWPALSVSADVSNSTFATATLSVDISGVSSADANGEAFSLGDDSRLTCGNASRPLEASGFDPAGRLTFTGISRATYHGDCSVSVQLIEVGAQPLFFGGIPSPVAGTGVSIAPPSLTAGGDDFRATWVQQRKPAVTVSYNNADPLLGVFASNWSLVLTAPDGTACGSANDKPTATIDVDNSCKKTLADGGTTGWKVTISFRYFGSDRSFTVPVDGTAPQPIDPTKMTFTAQWTGTATAPAVQIGYQGSYDNGTLGSLQWVEALKSSAQPDADCGTSNQTMTTSGVTVPEARCALTGDTSGGTTAPAPTFTVEITYTDPNYNTTNTYTVTVTGTPPS